MRRAFDSGTQHSETTGHATGCNRPKAGLMTLIVEAQLWGPNASLSHLMPSDTQLTTDDHFATPTSTQSALLHLTQIALTCMTLQDLFVTAKVHIIKPRQDLTHMPPPPP
ncbi:hypothetical protein PG984_013173 [Apiospora sp. TS-2023a]